MDVISYKNGEGFVGVSVDSSYPEEVPRLEEEDLSKYCERLAQARGFGGSASFWGDYDDGRWRVQEHLYSRACGGWYALWFLRFGNGNPEEVWLQNQADAMALRVLLAPWVATHLNTQAIETVEETLSRMFRAWHGHEADEACNDCDPLAASLQRMGEAEKARKKAERG